MIPVSVYCNTNLLFCKSVFHTGYPGSKMFSLLSDCALCDQTLYKISADIFCGPIDYSQSLDIICCFVFESGKAENAIITLMVICTSVGL